MESTGVNRLLAVAATLVAAMLSVAAVATAAGSEQRPGVLDTSFGRNGQITSTLPPAFLYGTFTHLAEGPSGELVASLAQSGGDFINPTARFAIERRRDDGSLDPSFGVGGSVVLPEEATALTVDASGRVLYALRDRVFRLGEDGSPDQSFAGTIPEAGDLYVERLAVMADGEIIAAGTYYEGGGKYVLPTVGTTLARLSPDGGPDLGFGRSGAISVPAPDVSHLGGLATLKSGSILLMSGGTVRRFTPEGALDQQFGTHGVLRRSRGFAPRAMLAGPDGELVLAGSVRTIGGEGHTDYVVRRYNAVGEVNRAFGDHGSATVDFADHDQAVELAGGPGGGIVLAGNSRTGKESAPRRQSPVLVRLEADGTLAPGFGRGGALAVEPPRRAFEPEPEPPSVAAMVVSPTGRIAIAGTNGDGTLAVRGYGGGVDPDFGAGASAILEVGTRPSTTTAADLVAEDDSELFVSAFTSSNRRNPAAAMIPFDVDGTQVANAGGKLHYLPLPLPGTGAGYPGNTVADGPQKLVTLARPPGSCCYLSRYDLRGRPDSGFGDDGRVLLPNEFDAAGVLVGHDHSLTVFGHTEGIGMTVVELTPDGHRNYRFGRNGIAHVSFASFGTDIYAALRLPSGKLLLAGTGGQRSERIALVRLQPDGGLDPGFGRDGVVLLRIGAASSARAVARQGRDFVITGVRHSRGYEAHAFVARLGADGRLDRSFGRHGYVEVRDVRRPLAIFPTRRGLTLVGDPEGSGVILRGFDRQGRVDRRFGRHGATFVGKSSTPFRLHPVSAVRQRDGRIVVAGNLGNSTLIGARIQLLRFR
jgi:uncharacterized delta-60 repeat protein